MRMEHWLEILQKIGKAMPQILAVFLVLGVGALVLFQWKKPELERLRNKDPYRYELMVKDASHLHWLDAWDQYVVLKEISMERLYQEHYARWQENWKRDSGFRQKILREKFEALKKHQQSQRKKYDSQVQELKQYRRKKKPLIQRVYWEQATPWQKSLMLRDGCVRYLSQELEDYRRRRNVKGSLHGAAVLAHPRISNASPGGLCREMVSLSHDEPSVRRALLKLKEGMNFYYFVRLLEDVGIPDSELFTTTGKLKGMTRDFNGF